MEVPSLTVPGAPTILLQDVKSRVSLRPPPPLEKPLTSLGRHGGRPGLRYHLESGFNYAV